MHVKVMSMACHFLTNQQLWFQGAGGAEVTLCHSLFSSFVSVAEELSVHYVSPSLSGHVAAPSASSTLCATWMAAEGSVASLRKVAKTPGCS